MKFSLQVQADILKATGDPVDIELYGALIKSTSGYTRYEEIVDSGHTAEIGTSVLTLKLSSADYDALDRASKYTYLIDGSRYNQRGAPIKDGTGFVKIQLTSAK